MVRAGDRLVRRSLITRDPDPVNARRAVLALTPGGLSLAKHALEVRQKAHTKCVRTKIPLLHERRIEDTSSTEGKHLVQERIPIEGCLRHPTWGSIYIRTSG